MQESKSVLVMEWAKVYSSKDSKFVMVGNVEDYKTRPEGAHVIVLNRSYPLSKEGVVAQKAREGKTVFLAFDSVLPTYTKLSDKEVLFHVNLDEEEVITKENVPRASLRPTRSLRTSSRRTTSRTRSRDTPTLL